MTADPASSALSRKLHALLHREAHLKLWRAQLTPRWSEKEAELRAVLAAKPTFLAFLSPGRRDAYHARLAAVEAAALQLRQRVELLGQCEPHIAKMIEQEIENLLREDCPEYIQALAAHRQKEDWLRCLERFGEKIFEFTRALGNVRNIACSGYARHTQAYSAAALQAFTLAFTAAEQVEEEVKFANKIADAQLAAFKANGVDTRPLPRLPETAFSVWVGQINSLPLAEAQVQFDLLIETTKRLHDSGLPALRGQADQVEHAQDSDIHNFLLAAWEQFRAEVAPEIFPGDTERSVAETEQLLQQMAKTSVLGRL